MATTFTRYHDFFEASEVAEFIQLLNSHKIEFIVGGTAIQIREEDIPKVNALLNAHAAILLDTVDKDYHLFTLSDNELMEIVARHDQWSAFDYQVAKSILSSREKIGSQRHRKLRLEKGILIAGAIVLLIVLIFSFLK